MYTNKREWLYRLSIANEAKVKEWYPMDRRPLITESGEVVSVFRNSTKGESKQLLRFAKLMDGV
jgi:hypothetical protein